MRRFIQLGGNLGSSLISCTLQAVPVDMVYQIHLLPVSVLLHWLVFTNKTRKHVDKF